MHDFSSPLNGYHDFKFTPTPTGAGGVGFFLKDEFDYDLRPNLKLNLDLCKNIWFKVKNVANTKLNDNGLIVGVIYLHGHDIKNFTEKLSGLRPTAPPGDLRPAISPAEKFATRAILLIT